MKLDWRKAGLALLALTIGGCVTTGTPGVATLRGSEWRVVQVGDYGVIAGSRASLGFSEDGRLFGNASCNRLVGTYRVDGSRLTLSNSGLTMMACQPAEMDQERRLVDILNKVNSYEIDPADRLVLNTDSGAKIVATR